MVFCKMTEKKKKNNPHGLNCYRKINIAIQLQINPDNRDEL